ncbi:Formamidase [Flagelloscypha sp. PMI_526]|nr:Formamidase [Flagelloscypha sp. PMI_526]
MSIHTVKREQNHLAWDNSIEPILRIQSGDEVTFDCLDASNGQITSTSDLSALSALDFSRLDQVNGPIYIEGAEPGSTLKVEVLEIETAEWGWTAIIPNFGVLSDADEFKSPHLKISKINKEEGYVRFELDSVPGKVVQLPLRPFAGEMGVAPGKNGAFSTIPPLPTGGNIDTRHVTVGSTLYLPIEAPGALFSIGDGHAAQGDGEVCGTAIETPIRVKVRLTVLKDRPFTATPHFQTRLAGNGDGQEVYGCTGVDSDLREATRSAVREMIKFLSDRFGLSAQDGYMLCSVAGDLKILEAVDMPNYLVGMVIPKALFPQDTW